MSNAPKDGLRTNDGLRESSKDSASLESLASEWLGAHTSGYGDASIENIASLALLLRRVQRRDRERAPAAFDGLQLEHADGTIKVYIGMTSERWKLFEQWEREQRPEPDQTSEGALTSSGERAPHEPVLSLADRGSEESADYFTPNSSPATPPEITDDRCAAAAGSFANGVIGGPDVRQHVRRLARMFADFYREGWEDAQRKTEPATPDGCDDSDLSDLAQRNYIRASRIIEAARSRQNAGGVALDVADQALLEVRAETIEECARLCDEHERWVADPGRFTVEERDGAAGAAHALASEIRRLARDPAKEGT